MPQVKDLVSSYESRMAPPSVSRTGNLPVNDRPMTLKRSASTLATIPSPRPARFIKHKNSDTTSRPQNEHHDFTTPHDLTTAQSHLTPLLSSFGESSNNSLRTTCDTSIQRKSLLYDITGEGIYGGASSSTLVARSQTTHSASSNTIIPSPAIHTPVPAITVFARNASPLYLPYLDTYLSSIKHPHFIPYPQWRKAKSPALNMFPPMNLLAATGKSLKDLEANSTVAPPWDNRNSIFGAATNLTLGLLGSSMIANFYSLQGILDTIQIFALLLSTIIPRAGSNIENKWKSLLLGTIPNILALNFASTFVQSLLFLLIFMIICAALLYAFYVLTNRCKPPGVEEGLQLGGESKNGWALLLVAFFLTLCYLPLSTLSVHALVWSDDFWVVANPYINATTSPPIVAPLGPPDQFRNPLDFCYTTTMKRNQLNYAPLIVIISIASFLLMTVWYPLRLRRVINAAVPAVDRYTELGKARNQSEMVLEYQRLLERDRSSLTFLYRDFRLGWGGYRAWYLFAKLTALLIIAIIDPNNCLFRSLDRSVVSIVRQSVLLVAMCGFFITQCGVGAFVDPTSNASEWTSRLSYVITALLGLLVALNVPGQNVYDGVLLYIIYAITYGLSFYFTAINWSWVNRVVKRLTHRIDFSIDIFSPRLDISPTSPHVRRRIWQEAISTLLFTSPECKIPARQSMIFVEAPAAEYPPYLLEFQGSPAERHVENLKILREVGALSYSENLTSSSGAHGEELQRISNEIQKRFIGPDSYWNNPHSSPKGVKTFFGNAWWIPFPPILVMQYDEGPLVTVQGFDDLRHYVEQNTSYFIQRKREIRVAIRALDGQSVIWPYQHEKPVGNRLSMLCCGSRYQAQAQARYWTGVLSIERRGDLTWRDQQLGSGFGVKITYAKNVVVDGSVIGLDDSADPTPTLARFLAMNQPLLSWRVPKVDSSVQAYRDAQRRDCEAKAKALSYSFLFGTYDKPMAPQAAMELAMKTEVDLRVRELIAGSEIALQASYDRFMAVTSSPTATWWYLLWDDLWRRNYDTISGLQIHAQDFDPHYPTSVAYTPLPRATLEAFLTERGLFSTTNGNVMFFNAGFLNKLYLRLNDIVFGRSDHAILFHVGDRNSEIYMDNADILTQIQSSTLGTGGGTDHDDSSIRARPYYRWESLLNDPLAKQRHKHSWTTKLAAWFGIRPFWRSGVVSQGLALDIQLKNGRYELLDSTPSPADSID